MADEDTRPPGEERPDDTFAVRARVTEEQALELIGRSGIDYGDRPHFSRGAEGIGQLDLFLSRAQITSLEADGIQVEVVNNQSARMRERIAELGEGDRFEGGKVRPTGIGRKFGGDASPDSPPPDRGPEPRS